MCRIPEPHEIADAYYARLEAEREAVIDEGYCYMCGNYIDPPRVPGLGRDLSIEFGYCRALARVCGVTEEAYVAAMDKPRDVCDGDDYEPSY